MTLLVIPFLFYLRYLSPKSPFSERGLTLLIQSLNNIICRLAIVTVKIGLELILLNSYAAVG